MPSVFVLIGAFVFLYWSVLADLIRDWTYDGNYSHGFLIIPLAAYFVFERRRRLVAVPVQPRASGLLIVLGGIAMLLAGELGAELFVTRLSMLPVIAGVIVFIYGWRMLGALAFPIALLLLMIPIPAIVFNQIAFPLQLVASRLGVAMLSALSIPVLREGNVIVLASTSLEVAEACSGIRSLMSLLTVAIVYGYLVDPRPGARTVLALASIPVAVLANGIRVAAIGIAANSFGPAAAESFFHGFSGWVMFVPAVAVLFLVGAIVRALPPRSRRAMSTGARAA